MNNLFQAIEDHWITAIVLWYGLWILIRAARGKKDDDED